MKLPTMAQLLSLLVTFTVVSVAIDAASEPVRDIRGKPVRAGLDYYILPVVRGRGGGLTMASAGNKTCPMSVVQDKFEVSPGFPLTFSPSDKSRIVGISTDQNVKFSAATICVQSTVWKLESFDETTKQWFVTTGGVEGNPGRETISNWFKIEKLGNDYKLVFCPTVCNFCKVICRDIGVFVQDGKRRLALSDVPLKVMFKRA
ncbi:PREDICTED: miraculin [Tarenaya hassleriana]|uniref:miraculin n=1 Tax=Tarenaya hassleriana TaxID=28532 RepID=UPI00053C8368|nr:PREDICTED: miraculin [Tarenaya hassleriana]